MALKDYTLVIPTYNRPKELRALLTYLKNQGVDFNILVLDSSHPQEAHENEKTINTLKLNIELVSFPSEMPPFEKFWKGVQKVKTSFCSLCADDDVLMTSAVAPLLDFLKKNDDYVAAHGLYFSFIAQKEIIISDLVYTKDVLMDDNPLIRLGELFQSYEAITYAIYRTPILEKVLSQVQSLDSLLGRELLGGSLTAAMGKVKRLPLLYCGRSLSASHFYESWHPLEMFLKSPDALYQEYGKYRKILLETLRHTSVYSEEDLYKLIDIIHFSYLREFIAPNILSYLSQQIMEKKTFSETMAGVWPFIIQNQQEKDQKKTKCKFSFLKGKLFGRKSTQEDLGAPQGNEPSFRFLDDFQTKIQPYQQRADVPLHTVLITNMNRYFKAA